MIERFFEAIKYEHLYRRESRRRPGLAAAVDTYQTIYNTIGPHEAIGIARHSTATSKAQNKPSPP